MAPGQVAERADGARNEDRLPGDIARFARKANARIHDLLQSVVEELRRKLAPVRAERVRLDQLRARPDEPQMHADDGLGSLEVCLLRTPEPRDRRRDERAGAAVGHDHATLVETLLRPAHRASLAREARSERSQLVGAGLKDSDVRLWRLVPRAGQVAERL